ncbi:SRPBCC domain-containing protein [Streptomyces zingiberis]|uniref:SRPBCC domain-containing protein n=1 Tax=Streptomyces zingiberis TaxID=2053010 RepID=UPI002892D4CE|nr:SRPBCC domain-containing protein [Streptomyces zingiberis]
MFVPFPAGTVRQALTDPERVSRCVPGFQWHAGAEPSVLAGRMRIRVGSATITYHGTLRIKGRRGGELEVEADGVEARGDGTVELALGVRLNAADGGTSLVCESTVKSRGRLAEADPTAAEAAGRRLLDRFAAALSADLEETPVRPAPPSAPASSGENGVAGAGNSGVAGAGNNRVAGAGNSGVAGAGDSRAAGAGRNGASGAGDSKASGDDGAAGARAAERRGGRGARGPQGTGPSAGGRDDGGTGPVAGREGAGFGRDDDNEPVIPGIPAPEPGRDTDAGPPGEEPDGTRARGGRGEEPRPGGTGAADAAGAADGGAGPGGGTSGPPVAGPGSGEGGEPVEPVGSGVPGADVPPPGPVDPLAEELARRQAEPPAEAAHARRTMIGRSAEEVDHAPPRGRYAPVPAPQPASAGDTLRWAAPVAAALVASAVIIKQVLRRRR